MTPTEALAAALNAVFDAIDFKNPHKSLSAIAAILAALDGYELVPTAAPAEGLTYAARGADYLWEVVGSDGRIAYSGVTESEARKAAAALNSQPAAPAEGLDVERLAHFIDGWLVEESPEVWSWTTEKIGRRLARDWVALAASGDAQPEAER